LTQKNQILLAGLMQFKLTWFDWLVARGSWRPAQGVSWPLQFGAEVKNCIWRL